MKRSDMIKEMASTFLLEFLGLEQKGNHLFIPDFGKCQELMEKVLEKQEELGMSPTPNPENITRKEWESEEGVYCGAV